MLIFKPATFNDFETWARFRNELYGGLEPDYMEAEIKRTLEEPTLASFIIYSKKNTRPGFIPMRDRDRHSGIPIGLIEMSLRNIVDGCISSPVAYIEGLYLIEKYRGRGLGKELINFIKKWAEENNCSELAVDTELENKKAQQFYLREGFAETYRIVQFKMNL